MQTLLEKVQVIEEEAKHIVEKAQQEGQQALQDFIAQEPSLLEKRKTEAQEKGQEIINTAVEEATQESKNADQKESTAAIRALAAKNEEAALALTKELFTQEFLNN